MFDNLTEKFDAVFKQLRGRGRLTEDNIQQAMREVRLALLEADVNFKVVKDFVAAVRERAVGHDVLQSLTPGQQVVQIVRDELGLLMGGSEDNQLNLAARPPVPIMLCGLQGAGKTTTCGKLALKLRQEKRNPLMVPADVYRPAAIEQLKTLGRQIDIPVFDSSADQDPVEICLLAREFADRQGYDTLILDTAGRLHVDDTLMQELERIRDDLQPQEILLVADAMTGQDAVNVASSFNERLDLTGVILTKLDALETFHPERMAQRILGMGDVLSLIEKAEAAIDKDDAANMEKRLREDGFTLETFKEQLQSIKKMGSMESMLSMIPGAGKALKKMKGMQLPDDEMKKIEAIIDSMTRKERQNHKIINGSRRLRIANGSGTRVQDVNQLLKRFTEAQKMMKKMQKMGPKGLRGMMGSGGMPM